ncbi:phosphoribosylaminoimidazolesuccinocarboxamide synthase [Desulfobacterales bacterium HSG16]|nr:phosphoribosylaminoimidazolesuccinocarboxamide synthase [Desulfobacterales bacterium HSG16]
MEQSVFETNFPTLDLARRGKVRDVYDLGDSLLLVATDRLSAFDVVMPQPIPGKGKILNLISLFWFEATQDIVENHLISSDVEDFPEKCAPYIDTLRGRSMLVKKAAPLPVECIVRGYVSGSGWKSYQKDLTICGINLPEGLVESDRLKEPIFTPSTKEEAGAHDINIDFDRMISLTGQELAEKAKNLSMAVYSRCSGIADKKDIIIADTKFEFGMFEDRLILIDEVMTPDSSRFWPKSEYSPGRSQNSFDKQYVRDYLISTKWNKEPPAPSLPDEVIENTRNKYIEALRLITGKVDGI